MAFWDKLWNKKNPEPNHEQTIQEEAGLSNKWTVVDRPPVGSGSPPTPTGKDPFNSGSLPINLGLQTDLSRTGYSGWVPEFRLMPFQNPPAAGSTSFSQQKSQEAVTSAATAQTTAVSAQTTANTANTNASTAQTTATNAFNTANTTANATPIKQMIASGTVDTTQSYFAAKGGSIVPQIVGTTSSIFSYTSTTTTVTITWGGFTVLNADGTTTSVGGFGGSQTITGLTANTTYYFYPYLDSSNTITFAAVSGGHGSPAILYTPQSPTAAQVENGQGVTALSNGGIQAITPASGSGSGSGGGSGVCVRSTMKVLSKSGIVQLMDCCVGDWIMGRTNWTEIKQIKILPQRYFIRITIHTGESVQITATHHLTTVEQETVEASKITLRDFLIHRDGYAVIKKIELIEDPQAEKITISCSPEHTFFAGEVTPTILCSNSVPIS